MRRSETFNRTRFSVEALLDVKAALTACFDGKTHTTGTWEIVTGEVTWTFESEAEFMAEYRRGEWARCSFGWVHLRPVPDPEAYKTYERFLDCSFSCYGETASVTIDGWEREDILAVQAALERHRESSRLAEPLAVEPEPEPEPVTVFIGHGGDAAWRDLKDHLQDLHGYRVIAYEVGARAGHEIRDVLEELLGDAAFACLVLTGEDHLESDRVQARQNVVHELGLFQGRLGFHRAIALVEDGIELPSNIAGVHQVRFSRGHIKSTFGDVLATLRREFDVRR